MNTDYFDDPLFWLSVFLSEAFWNENETSIKNQSACADQGQDG